MSSIILNVDRANEKIFLVESQILPTDSLGSNASVIEIDSKYSTGLQLTFSSVNNIVPFLYSRLII